MLYIYQYFVFGFKNCSTVYIQNVFSGVHRCRPYHGMADICGFLIAVS